MALPDRLKEARRRKGLSQELVAEHLEVSRQAVTKWESGQSRPNARNLQALAELYGIPVEELLDEASDGQKKTPNMILRANLIRMAIATQAGALYACAQEVYLLRSPEYTDKELYRGAFIFSLVFLALASIWMLGNQFYERDPGRRRKNVVIEFIYICIQCAVTLLTIHFGMGLVGLAFLIAVMLVYILYVNPKLMRRAQY